MVEVVKSGAGFRSRLQQATEMGNQTGANGLIVIAAVLKQASEIETVQ